MKTVGIDVSTQSCTVVAIDGDEQRIVGTWSFSFDDAVCMKKYVIDPHTKTIIVSEPGQYGQPPGMFLYALECVFKTMMRDGFDFSSVSAISVSAQQHGHVYLTQAYIDICASLCTAKAGSDTLEDIFSPCYAHAHAPIWMTSNTHAEATHLKTSVPDILQRTGSDSPLRFTGAIMRKTGACVS